MSTREDVLRILKSSKDYVSGEAVSKELCISRAAVNAAVKSLRLEGYEIDSATNRGYILKFEPDVFTEAAVGAYLDTDRMKRVKILKSVDSTNSEIVRFAVSGAESGQVAASDEQTGGMGRKGRSFASPKGKGVYFSYLFRPSEEIKAYIEKNENGLIWASLTSWTAVAAADALEKAGGVRPGIKWVNDLYMNGRKIAGILTQMNTSAESRDVETIVIGIGINVGESYEDFSEDIRDKAGSVYSETGKRISRASLCAELVKSFDKMINDWPYKKNDYMEQYVRDSILIGKNITVQSQSAEKKASAIGIDEDFGLIIENPDKTTEHIISGDVSIRFN